MENQHFLSRINWRQLLVHFIAGVFFVHAFTTLSFLYDTRFIVAYKTGYEAAGYALIAKRVTIPDLMNFIYWVDVSGVLGLLAAFIISLVISLKRGWFWVNPVIVLIAIEIIRRFIKHGKLLLAPLDWLISLTNNNPILQVAIKGILLLAAGTFLFFFPRLIRFIEKGLPQPVPEPTA
jgi:hypothetical protein